MTNSSTYWPRRWASPWLALLAGLLASFAAQAQQKVQVVTRTLEQSWACPAGTTVRIRAEKATMQVQGWDKPTVQVVLRLSARHAERGVAEQDLVAAQYRLQKNGSSIDLLNFFELPAGAAAVRSDLRADYTVFMPIGNALQVVNAYGQTELTDLAGRLRLEQSFGKISLRNLRGTLSLVARYADVSATGLGADLTCEASKSQLQLMGLAGTCLVRNYYGSVQVQPTPGLRRLTIEADRSEVVISAPQADLFDYQLSVQQGTLTVPAAYAAARKSTASRASLTTAAGGSPPRPLVRATTTYASLTLQTQLLSARF